MSASDKPVIVVVCRGNIGRSPFAEAVIRKELTKHGLANDYIVLSRGVQGTAIDPRPVAFSNISQYTELYKDAFPALEKFDVDLSNHRSASIDQAVAARAAVLLALDTKTLHGMQRLFPGQTAKMHLLSELVGQYQDITDPEGVSGVDNQDQIFTSIHDIVVRGFPALISLTNKQ